MTGPIARQVATAQRRAAAEARTLAAVEELLREGASFTELSVDRIASLAGLSRSTFYLYYRDKNELIVLLNSSLKAGLFEVARDWQPHDPAGGLDGLARMLEGMIAHYRERAATLAAILEVAGYDKTVRELLAVEQHQFVTGVAQRVRQEQRAGRAAADFDPLEAARVLVTGGQQVVVRQVTTGAPEDDARVARELATAQWYGVYRRPAQSV
ncbi:MAG TPA: TetR/AcrR family transcriptional regulator [Kribbella sp.]|jgi:AcrR family transcriptional regulator